MIRVAGVDGTPGGWALFINEGGRSQVRKVARLSEIFDSGLKFEVVAVDIPIGLLDTYEIGGRACDRAARNFLSRPRASSVFPAPVRPVLAATSWEDACVRSRRSAVWGKGVSRQTYAILPKIREVDDFLNVRPELRSVLREVHPEVSFCALVGRPMVHRKSSIAGREERREVLANVFAQLSRIEIGGRKQGIPIEDVFDAAIACWSALRLAKGEGRSLPDNVPVDAGGLPMAIWV